MGMDLAGAHGQFRVNYFKWPNLLRMAYENGWEPMGTDAPVFRYEDGTVETFDDWNGTYFSNSYQGVTAEDAANLADALERSLELFPDSGWVSPETSEYIKRDECRHSYPVDGVGRPYMGMVCLCAKCRQKVCDFIEFCRSGSFHIG